MTGDAPQAPAASRGVAPRRLPLLATLVAGHLAVVLVSAVRAPPLGDSPWRAAAAVGALAAALVLLARLARAGGARRAGGRLALATVAALFVATRVAWLAAVSTLPISDFAGYEAIAAMVARGEPIRMPWPIGGAVASWGYPVAIGLVARALGLSQSVMLVGKACNVVLGVGALLLLHRLALRVAGPCAAAIAAVAVAVWPGQLFMTSVLASEHLATPLLLAALLSLLGLLRSDSMTGAPGADSEEQAGDGRAPGSTARRAARAAGCGALAAACLAVRAALAFAVPAFVAALWRWRTSARGATALSLVLVAAVAGGTLAYRAGLVAAWGSAPLGAGWWTLLTGSSTTSHGSFSRDDRDRFFAQPSIDEANRLARAEIVRRWRTQPAAMLDLARRKTISLWLSDDYAVAWSTVRLPPTARSPHRGVMTATAQVVHAALLALAVAGCAAVARRTRSVGPAPGEDAILLVVAFGTLAHAVVESQARYHYVLQPLAMTLAAVGACALAAIPRPAPGDPTAAVDMAPTATSPGTTG
jgi:hypothetical protein